MNNPKDLFEVERLAIQFCESRSIKHGTELWAKTVDAFTSGYRMRAAPNAQGAAATELSQEEINFIKLVAQYPGSKLNGGEAVHNFDDGSEYGGRVCLWENPERLGLIECIGSYKWVPTNRISIGLLIDGNLAIPSHPLTPKE